MDRGDLVANAPGSELVDPSAQVEIRQLLNSR
jgi:hypothetical protein